MNFLKYFLFTISASFVIAFDQASKLYIHTHFKLHESLEILPFFNFTYVRNFGGAFGFLNNPDNPVRKWIFLLVPLIACIVIFSLLKETKKENKIEIIGLGFILGGALGNIIDRLRFEYVIDFLDFYIMKWHYPVFNLADSAIVCGVGILIAISLKEGLNKKAS